MKRGKEIMKKLNKLMASYESKLEPYVWLYHKKIVNFSKAYDYMFSECKKLEDLLLNMFHFGLISEKEYEEVVHVPFEVFNKYVDEKLHN